MSDKYFIHPTAHVSDKATIEEGCQIWINAQVREGAHIGKNTIISKDVYIDKDVSIGRGCKVQNSVSVYHGVTIEDDVFVGPNATFTNDKVPRAFNNDWSISMTTLKKGVSLGANCTIVCGITIGEYAMIAAGAVVTKNVEPHALMMGNPAKCVGYVDKMGNKK